MSRSKSPLLRPSRRQLLAAGSSGMAAILASGRAPVFAQAAPKKLDFANILGAPDVGGIAMEHFAKVVTERAKGELEVKFHGGTLIAKEMEIMNAVKTGNGIGVVAVVGQVAGVMSDA